MKLSLSHIRQLHISEDLLRALIYLNMKCLFFFFFQKCLIGFKRLDSPITNTSGIFFKMFNRIQFLNKKFR